MSLSSVNSAVMASGDALDLNEALTNDLVKGSLKSGRSISIGKVLEKISHDLIKNFFESGSYDEVVNVTTDLLIEKATPFLLKARGESYAKLHKYENAIKDFTSALELTPNCHMTLNNLGLAYKEIGFLKKASERFEQAIKIFPEFSEAHNNYGNVQSEQANISGAKISYLKSIDLQPSNAAALWNLHSTANDIDQAKSILELCLETDAEYEPAIYSLATINAFKGNTKFLEWILTTELAADSTLRSIQWILSLPVLPKLEFNRWRVFDFALESSKRERSFYEFGVWMGESFRYLGSNYKKSYGFDTFAGLPEDWHNVPSGTYSSFGKIPKIPNSEFIVGEFSKSLPKFFSSNRPTAGLLNFDADLYTSTACALNYSRPVIDEYSILVFDELIVNQNWEQDEYRALIEFCENYSMTFEVTCVSLFTKQVVLRVKSL
jgi:tetratricopeptide (TPR) repeat protein